MVVLFGFQSWHNGQEPNKQRYQQLVETLPLGRQTNDILFNDAGIAG